MPVVGPRFAAVRFPALPSVHRQRPVAATPRLLKPIYAGMGAPPPDRAEVFKQPRRMQGPTESLAAAQRVLDALRGFSFGGRLAVSGDKLATLMDYYPSLRAIADLAAHGDMRAAAREAVQDISLPKDLQAWLLAAMKAVPTKPAAPVPAPAAAPTAVKDYSQLGKMLPSKPCGTRTLRARDILDHDVSAQWFDTSDHSLELVVAAFGGIAGLLYRRAYASNIPIAVVTEALKALDRSVFLNLEAGRYDELSLYLKRVNSLGGTAPECKAYVQALAQAVMRCGIDPDTLHVQNGMALTQYREFKAAWEALERRALGACAPVEDVPAASPPAVDLPAQLALWRPESTASAQERAACLVGWLQQPVPTLFGAVLPAIVVAMEQGAWQRLNFAALDEATQASVLQALARLNHPGVTLLFAALLLADDGDAAVVAQWQKDGHLAAQTEAWAEHMATLRAIDAARLDDALQDVAQGLPNFTSLALRSHLACNPVDSLEAVHAAQQKRQLLDPTTAQQLIIAHASQEAVREWVRAHEDRDVYPHHWNEALGHGAFRRLMPYVDADLRAAVQACHAAGCTTEANEKLVGVLRQLAAWVPTPLLVRAVLADLHHADVAKVLPLGDVDATPAAAHDTPRHQVNVAGVMVDLNQDPHKDRRAVPRRLEADLVMTPTTETNLWRLATMVRAGKSVLLEGPTSAGKTSAVRYLAYKTNTPLRRITLSFRSEVPDLIGRWVAGTERYNAAALADMSDVALDAVAKQYGVSPNPHRAAYEVDILRKQRQPRWVDGVVVQAVRRGEWLILDEINLAPAEVIERLNSLFDDDGNITLESGEKIPAHRNFRAFATMNPGNYVGRGQLSEALRSRWARVFCQGLSRTDLTKILKVRFGEAIPTEEMQKLLVVHNLLSEAADKGNLGRQLGGVSYSLRNLRNVCERFIAYRGKGLSDAALMRRETEEVYRDGLPPQDQQAVNDVLTAAMPYDGPAWHTHLKLEMDADSITLGDVTLPRVGPRDGGERAMLVLTPRTLQLLYRLAKIVDRGENALLIGGKASGKTALVKMLAYVLGQPYYRQMIGPATDTMQLVGSYTTAGWQDGVILQGGRPENTPAITLLDEINLGDSATLERLNGALEKDDRTLVLVEGDGSVVHLHPQAHLMGAMNPPGEKYSGRKRLSKALQNRMTPVYVAELTEFEELQLITRGMAARKIADGKVAQVVADALLDTHQRVVKAYDDGKLGKGLLSADKPVLSVRTLLRALDITVELMRDRSVGQAFVQAVEVSYASEASPADNASILDMAQQVAA